MERRKRRVHPAVGSGYVCVARRAPIGAIGLLSLLGGCTLLLSSDSETADDGTGEPDPDAAPSLNVCDYSNQLSQAGECSLTSPDAALDFDAGVYALDTETGELIAPEGPSLSINLRSVELGGKPVAVWFVESFELPRETTLEVFGDRALLLLADDRIDVRGTIDVSSDSILGPRGPRIGPGMQSTGCGSGGVGVPSSTLDGGGSGGGGGGFQGRGGRGGDGNDSANVGGVPGSRMAASPQFPVRGCNGGEGGFGSGVSNAQGGAGGGAIQLTARNSINLASTSLIDAGGAGGEGAVDEVVGGPNGDTGGDGGGGGGGAGGYIGLEAPSGELAGQLSATGGGGGGGSINIGLDGADGSGGDGNDGDASGDSGLGGTGTIGSTPGANGSTAVLEGGDVNGGTDSGAGGGGGGAGWVIADSRLVRIGQSSPPTTSW